MVEPTRICACLVPLLLLLAFASTAGAQDPPTDTDADRAAVLKLLDKVDLDAREATALLALPGALQKKILRVLARETNLAVFDAAERALVQELPRSLRERILDPRKKEEETPVPPEEPVRSRDRQDDAPEKPAIEEEGAKASTQSPPPKEDAGVERPGAVSRYPLQDVEVDLAPFGADLFARRDATPARAAVIPAPSDYVLGPGDVLLIHYWNALEDQTFVAEITTEGRVGLPRAGEVVVGGLPLDRARELLEKRIHEIYKDADVLVTLQSLRALRVFVVGEVMDPGLHALPGLSTVFHALFAAGGPLARGSYRRIRLVRGGETVSEIDLYTFLREGTRGGDVRLLSGDTVFVPLAGPRVTIAGEVKRPAVYELRDESDLEAVLALAGGIAARGYDAEIRIERAEEGRLSLLDVSGDASAQEVRDGDVVKVFPVFPEAANRVELCGAVERPGAYQWREGMTASRLLRLGGRILPGAFTKYAEIRRAIDEGSADGVTSGGRTWYPAWKILRVDLSALLAGAPEADVELRPQDRLRVLSLEDVPPRLTVEIRGAVAKPGAFEFAQSMRLLDLLFREGQALLPDAHVGRAEIVRRVGEGKGYAFAFGSETTPARTVTIPVDLEKALAGDPEANVPLEPFDVVKIYYSEEVRPAPTVTVLGAVGEPQTMELTSEMRVSDLVFKAGNITADAYLDRGEILRRVHDPKAPAMYKLVTLPFDLGRALQGDAEHDLPLENFDRVIIRRTAEFFVEAEVKGEVRFPGTYLMPKGGRLMDLIERAGGFTQEAYLPGAFFTRRELQRVQEEAKERFLAEQRAKMVELEAQAAGASPETAARMRESLAVRRRLLDELESLNAVGRLAIRLASEEGFSDSPHNLVLRDGDRLRIPETPVSVTVQGEVFAPGSVLFTEGKRIEHYLHQVGGLREEADEDRIYIVKADGRALTRSAPGAFSVRWDPENLRWVRNRLGRVVDPGDIVIVPPKPIVVHGYDLTKDIVDILYKIALSAGVLAGLAG